MPRARFHLYLSLGLLTATAVLTAPPAVDLTVAAWFYDADADDNPAGGWVHQPRWPWIGMYDYGLLSSWGMAIAAAALLPLSFYVPRLMRHRRRLVVMLLAVVLGPGLAVNVVLKENWGRPRPNRVQQFDQAQTFRAWWQPNRTPGDRSFLSGHVSMTFALLAATLTIEHRRRRQWATAAAVAYGCLMIAARVAAGAHWLSDALIAAALTYVAVALLLHLPDREARAPDLTAQSPVRTAA